MFSQLLNNNWVTDEETGAQRWEELPITWQAKGQSRSEASHFLRLAPEPSNHTQKEKFMEILYVNTKSILCYGPGDGLGALSVLKLEEQV